MSNNLPVDETTTRTPSSSLALPGSTNKTTTNDGNRNLRTSSRSSLDAHPNNSGAFSPQVSLASKSLLSSPLFPTTTNAGGGEAGRILTTTADKTLLIPEASSNDAENEKAYVSTEPFLLEKQQTSLMGGLVGGYNHDAVVVDSEYDVLLDQVSTWIQEMTTVREDLQRALVRFLVFSLLMDFSIPVHNLTIVILRHFLFTACLRAANRYKMQLYWILCT